MDLPEHLHYTRLCPAMVQPLLVHGLPSLRPRQCPMGSSCVYAHELTLLELPKWSYDLRHSQRSKGRLQQRQTKLEAEIWLDVHVFVGQRYGPNTKRILRHYARGLPKSFLPSWYHLWEWIEASCPSPLAAGCDHLLSYPWDFGHFDRLRHVRLSLNDDLPYGDYICALDDILQERRRELDVLIFASDRASLLPAYPSRGPVSHSQIHTVKKILTGNAYHVAHSKSIGSEHPVSDDDSVVDDSSQLPATLQPPTTNFSFPDLT